MSSKQSRKSLYIKGRQELGLSQSQLGRLMHLGESKGQSDVFKKEQPIESQNSRGVSLSEALALQLLVVLKQDGYDINSFSFLECGRIDPSSIESLKGEKVDV